MAIGNLSVIHNISAVYAHRHLLDTDFNINRNIEKLSSGYRINRAADDAAGLAISEKLRTQVSGLQQSIRNANDGVSVIQTAEAALEEIQVMNQRMRTLAVQVANGTYVDSDRAQVQVEMDHLLSEIDRMSEAVEFNTLKLFRGDFSPESPLSKAFLKSINPVATKAAGQLDIHAKWDRAGFEILPEGNVTINGETFSLADYKTPSELMAAINESEHAAVTLDYDADKDRFTIKSDISQAYIRLYQSSSTNGFFAATHLTSGTTPPPGPNASGVSRFEVADGTANIIDLNKSWSAAGFDNMPTGTVTINGVVFRLDDYATVKDFMRAINTSEKAKATIIYDKDYDEFTIKSDNPKEDLVLTENEEGGIGFLTEVNITRRRYLAPTRQATEISIREITDEANKFINLAKGFGPDNFDHQIGGRVVINGAEFKIEDYLSVAAFMDDVNSSDKAAVTITYDNVTDQFIIRSDQVGRDLELVEIESTVGFGFFTETNIPTGKIEPPKVDSPTWKGSLVLHIGANEYQTMSMYIQTLSTAGLKIDRLKGSGLTTRENAEESIEKLQRAIDMISVQRANLGAYQNRLEHLIKSLRVAEENMTSAESQIRDVDMALEMSDFVKNQILSQSGTAMLAQANLKPQTILQLLS